MTEAALLFARAQAVVGDQIREAVARTGGDAQQALYEILHWAAERPGGGRLLIQSVRHRVGCLPVIDEIVDGVFELVGGDEDAAHVILKECIASPLLRDRLDRQIGQLAGEALMEWVGEACAAWREKRLP